MQNVEAVSGTPNILTPDWEGWQHLEDYAYYYDAPDASHEYALRNLNELADALVELFPARSASNFPLYSLRHVASTIQCLVHRVAAVPAEPQPGGRSLPGKGEMVKIYSRTDRIDGKGGLDDYSWVASGRLLEDYAVSVGDMHVKIHPGVSQSVAAKCLRELANWVETDNWAQSTP